ncbi:hypothetical protein MCOR13_011936 [Pyricularia oryzae]|nr:hypothetical protein MCOR13_011936 [Pyricularia oryzae]
MKGHHFLKHHADLGDMARAVCIFADEMISVPLKQGVWRFDKEKKGLPKTAKDLVLRFNTEYYHLVISDASLLRQEIEWDKALDIVWIETEVLSEQTRMAVLIVLTKPLKPLESQNEVTFQGETSHGINRPVGREAAPESCDRRSTEVLSIPFLLQPNNLITHPERRACFRHPGSAIYCLFRRVRGRTRLPARACLTPR